MGMPRNFELFGDAQCRFHKGERNNHLEIGAALGTAATATATATTTTTTEEVGKPTPKHVSKGRENVVDVGEVGIKPTPVKPLVTVLVVDFALLRL